jgi:hypothetical protein
VLGAPLPLAASLTDLLRRITTLVGIDVAGLAQHGIKILAILVLAWLAKRLLHVLTRRRIKNRFDAERITIPFPQRTLHLGDAQGLLEALRARSSP